MDEKNDDSLPSGENADAETFDTVLPVEDEGDLEQEQNMEIEGVESAGIDTNADILEATDAEECADGETLTHEESAEQSIDPDAQLDITPPNADEIAEAITEETGDHSSSTDTAATDSIISVPAPTAEASMSSDVLASALSDNFGEKVTDDVEQPSEESSEMKTSSAVYSLEEELQRMHEGDPLEEPEELQSQPSKDTVNEDENADVKPVVRDIKPVVRIAEQVRLVERNVRPAEKTYRGARSVENKVAIPVLMVPESPIMKDSDLEEILGAEEVLKDPILIKDAQEDMKLTDVLVCGRCYESFIFVEEFQKHKLKSCRTKTDLPCENETKPQVWGFTLWKSRQLKTSKTHISKNSDWQLYKHWCSLAETDKNAWIAAGQSLQFCNKIGTGKLTEVRQILQSPKVHAKEEKDPLALDGFESNKENSTITVGRKPIIDLKKPLIRSVRVVKDTVSPVGSISPKVIPKADPNVNRATRTLRSTDKGERGEYAVERIVAKRFNPKKKVWEYQIKWEHFPSDANTWEPMENLNHCKQMVEDFEQQLAKLKAERAQQQAANLVKNRPKILNTQAALSTPTTSSIAGTPNRPQRTSKQKALNQVKAWCGSISDEENAGAAKRARSPDSDDSFEKRMKFESDESDSDSKMAPQTPQKVQYKKIAPKPQVQVVKNGLGQVGSLPPNVLIPDANGVVRINQKQLPSLSAGVYIMSKTAGIIKLDSNTSKVATSGGQTIVKVAPKIGQTQIKVVKKDGSTTRQIVQMSPQSVRSQAGGGAAVKRPINIRPMVKKGGETVRKGTTEVLRNTSEGDKGAAAATSVKKAMDAVKQTPKGGKAKDEPRRPAQLVHPDASRRDDSDDDGLEELPFPEEIKLPEPESPHQEEDFFLDPSTGKIAGQEYPEPSEEAEPEVAQEEEEEEGTKAEMSLDNIVKLAAADITEEDLKNEPGEVGMDGEEMPPPTREEEEMMEVEEEKIKLPIRTEPIRKIISTPQQPQTATRTVVRMPALGGTRRTPPSSSILNKVLTGGQQAVRRSVIGAAAPKAMQQHQRILNPTVARAGGGTPHHVTGPIIRPMGAFARAKQVQQGRTARGYPGGMPPKVVRTPPTTSPRNIYSYSKSPGGAGQQPVTRKIGHTIIRTTSSPAGGQQRYQQLVQPRTLPQPQRVAPAQQRQAQPHGGLVQRFTPKADGLALRGQPEMVEPVAAAPRKVAPAKPKKVISMPSLMGDDDLLLVPKPAPQQQPPQRPQSPPPATAAVEFEPAAEAEPVAAVAKLEAAEEQPAGGGGLAADMSTFTLADNDNPIFITGDDGTVYQVAGQNEQGQTILLTQGSDGQQQCLLVTNEVAEAMETSPQAEEPQQPVEIAMPDIAPDVTEPLSVKTDVSEGGDQVVAQVVRAEPPSPGGTHKVVVMLPDGNLMVTQVSPEEYASLELE